MQDNYRVEVNLRCSTCGSNSSFITDEETGIIKCSKCNRIYYGGREELIGLNQNLIEVEFDSVKNKITKDLHKQISDSFKKAGFKIK